MTDCIVEGCGKPAEHAFENFPFPDFTSTLCCEHAQAAVFGLLPKMMEQLQKLTEMVERLTKRQKRGARKGRKRPGINVIGIRPPKPSAPWVIPASPPPSPSPYHPAPVRWHRPRYQMMTLGDLEFHRVGTRVVAKRKEETHG